METMPITGEDMSDSGLILAKIQLLEDRIVHLTEIKNLEHQENRVRIERFQALLEKYDHILLGNAKPGLVTQMDRLLQKEESRTWTFRAIAASTIGLVLKAIFDVFTGHP